ncbi:L-rhamnose-binding lectin SML-like [Lytechinus variegatus]|uniref:L-rhamnose-binding lectin SML-like n=1 Tax=Lytechinus variegatus TaxID=7654 RepID=UPI001BB12175|nr:L-rhamnose-binding lectin SML-like [Lytechinus variegatus]
MKRRLLFALVASILLTELLVETMSEFTSTQAPTSCRRPPSMAGDIELNYTLPIYPPCGEFTLGNGSVIIKIPKLLPTPFFKSCRRDGIPAGHRICRSPDCLSGPCKNGWCEETMENYHCHCPEGFSGNDCSIATGTPTGASVHTSNVSIQSNVTTENPTSTSQTTQSSSSIMSMWASLSSAFTSLMSTAPATAVMSTTVTTMPNEDKCGSDPSIIEVVGLDNIIICEGRQLDITCQSGFTMRVLSANYGRTDNITCRCKSDPVKMEKTNCHSNVTTKIQEHLTDSKLIIRVENNVFQEPCQGTYKYLNITYKCN